MTETLSIEHTPHNSEIITRIPLFAHQGGWDEALMVGLPLALIGLLLWVANRRVSAQLAEAAERGEQVATTPGSGGDSGTTAGTETHEAS